MIKVSLFASHKYFCPTFFFFNDTATTVIYTLSLHDALPISDGIRPPAASRQLRRQPLQREGLAHVPVPAERIALQDRKSTRLNSSHPSISYAVFCLKKKIQVCSKANNNSFSNLKS